MFKKPSPSKLNGIAELIRQADDSKTLRTYATRRLLLEIEEQRRRQKEGEMKEYIKRGQRSGAL